MSFPAEPKPSDAPASAGRTRLRGVVAFAALVRRAGVLLGLIVRAAWLYGKTRAFDRGLWYTDEKRLARAYTRFALRFVRVASRLRGGLIKLGQVASLRVDVVPDQITDELARLQDRVPPHPFSEMAAQLSSELGPNWSSRFADFDSTPIASASLGQVHVATGLDGQKLAVKILYPGVERSVAVDLVMLRLALRLFNFVSFADLGQVYREMSESIRGEMDYVQEGRAAEEVAANLSKDESLWAHLRVPAIVWSTTTRRVLSMEFIEGVKINDADSIREQGLTMDELVTWSTRAFLHMMFRDGFFHCDPHPGNLLVDSKGRVALIDFGMNKRIDQKVLGALRDNVIATVKRDPERFADSMISAGMVGAAHRAALLDVARTSFDPEYYNLTPAELARLDFGEYFSRMRVQMKRLPGFQLPDGIVMWSRALSLLYGLSVELAPGLRPLDVVGPYVVDFLREGS